ncbi:MAG: hypothetical protein JRI47_07300 [Deltaproteobacteria bacterium]|nr:hypothetical protein [Deltaproteobacteria bacterium]
MSKYMQMRVRIDPFYKKGFEGAYPRISRGLAYMDEDWSKKERSLFEIAGQLDQLLYQLEADPPVREIVLKHKSALHGLYESIEEKIADWHLAEADQLLYKMEDIFDEIERELGKI